MSRIAHLLEASSAIHTQNTQATGAIAEKANETAKLNMELQAKAEQKKMYVIAAVVLVVVLVGGFLLKNKKK